MLIFLSEASAAHIPTTAGGTGGRIALGFCMAGYMPVQEDIPGAGDLQAAGLALAHAGLGADAIRFPKTEFDWDDGVPQWDVEFRVDRWEYSYEIHAETGKILEYDKDWDD